MAQPGGEGMVLLLRRLQLASRTCGEWYNGACPMLKII